MSCSRTSGNAVLGCQAGSGRKPVSKEKNRQPYRLKDGGKRAREREREIEMEIIQNWKLWQSVSYPSCPSWVVLLAEFLSWRLKVFLCSCRSGTDQRCAQVSGLVSGVACGASMKSGEKAPTWRFDVGWSRRLHVSQSHAPFPRSWFVQHCPLPGVYLLYWTFRHLSLLPSPNDWLSCSFLFSVFLATVQIWASFDPDLLRK